MTVSTDPTCIFCRIIAGEIPCKEVYSDLEAVAFLDVEPLKRGHTLVVPRAHVTDPLAAPHVLARMAPAIAATGALLQARLGATGMNLVSNIGADAGQSVFHLHVHLVPRYSDDPGMGSLLRKVPGASLDEVHARLTA